MLIFTLNMAYQAAHPSLKQDDGKSKRYMRVSISFVINGTNKLLDKSSERSPSMSMAAKVVQSNLP